MPPWSNLWLIGSMALSFSLHFVILYVEVLSVSSKSFQIQWNIISIMNYLVFFLLSENDFIIIFIDWNFLIGLNNRLYSK